MKVLPRLVRPRAWLAAFACSLAAPCGGASASASEIGVELNKLEGMTKGCRAYIVANNATDQAYSTFKLDLIFFRPDAVIDRRLAVELAPLPANKRSVKSFDLEGVACDAIGAILINDVMDCRSGASTVDDCLGRISPSSRAAAPLSK